MTLEAWNRDDEEQYGFYLKADNGAVVMWSHNYNFRSARHNAMHRLSQQLNVPIVYQRNPKRRKVPRCQECEHGA